MSGTAPPRKRRPNYLTAVHYYRLNLACAPLTSAFEIGVFLVGSCLVRPDFRDVDVRAIVEMEQWTRMFGGDDGANTALWSAMCVGLSEHLSRVSGLPVDFQIQEMGYANAAYPGEKRSALGLFVPYVGGPSD